MKPIVLSRRHLLGASLALAVVANPLGRVFAAEPVSPLRIRLTFDDSAVKRLLDLIDAKDASDASINALLDLPAYKMMIRVGEAEGSLTREALKANAKAVILGTAAGRDQPRSDAARLVVTDVASYRDLLKELEASATEREARIAARLQAFTPENVRKSEIAQTVYLHLGGTWDAINKEGDIFINLHYWHDYNKPSLDGMNLVVAHEMTHTIQNKAYGNPESQEDGPQTFLTALSKIQREGIARYVETETDPEPYGPYTYGFFYRAVDSENLRAFASLPKMLGPLAATCFPDFDRDKFATVYAPGMDSGGPFYALGHGIAKAIDEKLGRVVLLETMEKGPKEFFTRYADLSKKSDSLPPLPDNVLAALKVLPDRLPTS